MIDRDAHLVRRTLTIGALTGLLFAVVISLGILGERLAPGNVWIVTAANVIGATAALPPMACAPPTR